MSAAPSDSPRAAGPASRAAAGVDPSLPAAIAATGLGRAYGDVVALRSLDLTVAAGSLVGIIGPNGAGKTTAMLILATLLRPSHGNARLFGLDLARDRMAIRRRLGLVFQEASVDGLLTVRENLEFAAGLAGLRGRLATDAVNGAIARTGLESHAARPARTLSGGWRRLTDIARATIHHPDLLILDEPTVGLDPEHRDRMWSLLEAERRQGGTTILFSTHYLAEAERCDDVLMLARGDVVAHGTPAALMADVGTTVMVVEGTDAALAVRAVDRDAGDADVLPTERGYRVGIRGDADLAAIVRQAPRLTRLDLRPVSLEDVYFARTQTAAMGDATDRKGPVRRS